MQTAFDHKRLSKLRTLAGDAVVLGLIELFLARIPIWIGHARVSFEMGSAKELSRAAHTIASCAANVGAEELRAAAVELEGAAFSPETTGFLLARIELANARASATLKQVAGGLSRQGPSPG
ncbi:MAG: Hpt domain-containing protein [Deltaproteobacteria bacterium]|nr:Hpt domain-containing protein [Deltaproteobacteria bacterium]